MRAYLIDSTDKWLFVALFAVILLLHESALARSVTGLQVDSPQELRGIAFRRHLEYHDDTALDFYQKAIDKSIKEYGPTSSYTGALYFEMGMLAAGLSKFSTAEYCLTKAVQINPRDVVARLKLAELLRLREKPTAARAQLQQSVERNVNSVEARQQLAAWLQDTNPAAAAKQSYLLRQILIGIPLKPTIRKPSPQPAPDTSAAAKRPAATDKSPAGKPAAAAAAKAKDKSKKTPAVERPTASADRNKAKAAKAEEKKAAQTKEKTAKGKAASKPAASKDKSAPTKESAQAAKENKAKPAPAKQNSADGLQEQKAQPAAVPEEPKQTVEPVVKQATPPPVEHKAPKPAAAPAHKPAKKSARDLVPPPPAVTLPPMFVPPPVHQVKPVKPTPESKPESAKASHPEKSTTREPASSSGAAEDPDFLLEWGSVKKHKPGKSATP